MTEKRPNITPELIGEFYTDGKEVYRLIACETEPRATMEELINPGVGISRPISEFASFTRLIPERPIVKPEPPRKPRANKGKPREKKSEHRHFSISEVLEAAIPQVENPEQVKLYDGTRKAGKREAASNADKMTRQVSRPLGQSASIQQAEKPDISGTSYWPVPTRE